MHRYSCQFVPILILAACALTAQEQTPDLAEGFLARDSHEGVTIAARPIPDTPAAEAIFGRKAAPTEGGFLPVELLIINERAEEIWVGLEKIKILGGGEEYTQAKAETIALWLYPPPGAEAPKPGGRRLPIPWPRKPKLPKDKKRAAREEAEASLRSRQLRAAQVAPGGHARGFLYFDLRGEGIDLTKASVYLPEVELALTGEALFFFEITLKAYAKP